MKTLLTASALMLVANISFADSWEQAWQSPDLNTGVYDKPVTLVEPTASSYDSTVSLDTFNEGNPDHASHKQQAISTGSGEDFASSLDIFNKGNPDHV